LKLPETAFVSAGSAAQAVTATAGIATAGQENKTE